ncbi:MAG: ATP synthase F1 subunit epsilon [Bacteroidetes bacterium]|nr:MAG: ATP synthase F1 subunit epsilon [Bacteroidota bacterium]
MQLDIVTPDEQIYSGEVKLIKLPGVDGSFEILKNHAPLISTLEKGKIKIIEENNEVKFFEINDGVVEVQSNKVIVLAGSV